MRKIKNKIYSESKYIGVHLGMVSTNDGLLLVDSPLKVDEVREWLSQAGEYGEPRYLALLDAHPDRVLGARAVDLPIIAHDQTLETIREWSDTFKGNLHPIGAEADRLKRITGVQRAAPEVVFADEMLLTLGEVELHFLHQPGPQLGSMWIRLPGEKTVFIGDTVTLSEPPYIGAADLEQWAAALDELRSSAYASFTLISSQGGPVKRDDINAMARFLRKVENRLDKLAGGKPSEEDLALMAKDLLGDFKVPGPRADQALLRLQSGLLDILAER